MIWVDSARVFMPSLGMSPIAVVEVNDSAAQALMAGALALFFSKFNPH